MQLDEKCAFVRKERRNKENQGTGKESKLKCLNKD